MEVAILAFSSNNILLSDYLTSSIRKFSVSRRIVSENMPLAIFQVMLTELYLCRIFLLFGLHLLSPLFSSYRSQKFLVFRVSIDLLGLITCVIVPFANKEWNNWSALEFSRIESTVVRASFFGGHHQCTRSLLKSYNFHNCFPGQLHSI